MVRIPLLALLCTAILAAGDEAKNAAKKPKKTGNNEPADALVASSSPNKDSAAKIAPKTHPSQPTDGLRCLARWYNLNQPNCGDESQECPLRAPFHKANITVSGGFRHVETSYCPPYDWSCIRSPKRRRPCVRKQTFKIPLKTVVATAPVPLGLGWPRGGLPRVNKSRSNRRELKTVSPMLGAIGVLMNGVALNAVASKLSETLEENEHMEGEDSWVDAGEAETWMDDICGGHLSGGGNYHTHIGSPHHRKNRTNCGLPADEPNAHSQLLGWAFDGYSIYGALEDGKTAPKDIDACGGHVNEAQGGYHYHLSDTYPYALECYHGCPEQSNNFRFKDLKCEALANSEL